MCTDVVTILYDNHEVVIAAKSVAAGGVQVTVDKEMVYFFPYRSPWLSLEQPDLTQVLNYLSHSVEILYQIIKFTCIFISLYV